MEECGKCVHSSNFYFNVFDFNVCKVGNDVFIKGNEQQEVKIDFTNMDVVFGKELVNVFL